jgi:hypothetical protein
VQHRKHFVDGFAAVRNSQFDYSQNDQSPDVYPVLINKQGAIIYRPSRADRFRLQIWGANGGNCWFGTAQFQPPPVQLIHEFGGRANVNYVYAKPTGALASMHASFVFKSEPAEQMALLLDAKENDGTLGCKIEIKLNDTVLLSGPNGFPKIWRVRAFDIPKSVLRVGTNTVTIRSLEETGRAGLQPWFMVSRCGIGPAGTSLPRLVSFRKYSVSLPKKARPIPETLPPGKKPGFKIRGIKGWNWTANQYLEEIPILAEYRMNFLMNCYLSNFDTDGKRVNKWWEPLPAKRKQDYIKIFRQCKQYHINFCFAVHPQLASPRPLDPNKMEDIDDYYRHFVKAFVELFGGAPAAAARPTRASRIARAPSSGPAAARRSGLRTARRNVEASWSPSFGY